MGTYQRAIALMLVACLVALPYGQAASSPQGGPPQKPTRAKQRVELFGVGAVVKVKLASGKKLRGSIGAIDEAGFDLMSKRGSPPRRITYDQMTELKLAKSTYRASGAPNAEEVRRVVAGLGVGKHVAAKVASGVTFRGHLGEMNDDHFVLLLDREGRPMEIAYADVQKLGPNPSTGKTIAMVAVGVIAVFLIVAYVATYSEQ